MKRAITLATLLQISVVSLALLGMATDASARGRTGAASVDCDAGDSLQAALNKGFDGMTFNVAGTCDEVITVELNNVIINGRGLGPNPIPRGTISCSTDCLLVNDDNPALVKVRGNNVLIKNMTIRDGTYSGLAVQLSSSVVLKRNIIRNNDVHGVIVTSGSHAFIGSFIGSHSMPDNSNAAGFFPNNTQGNIIKLNGGTGIVARLGAVVDVFHNQILSNEQFGISLSNGGTGDIDGNDIKGNGDAGISVKTNASVRLDDDAFHGEGEPTQGNKIVNNGKGLACKIGGVLSGNIPTFGGGNPDATGNLSDVADSCHNAL